MNKYLFRRVVSRFIFEARSSRGFGITNQSDIARGLGVRDATVSSWANQESCISAHMLFRLFSFFATVNRTSFTDIVSRFISLYSSMIDD